MNSTIYYAPDAIGSAASYFFDGIHMYQRVQGLGSLGALHGWLKRIGKKIKKGIKKVGKGLKKVAKGYINLQKKAFKTVVKVAKAVGKVTVKIIKKALPIVNTALTFFPGVGWMAKAALTVAEMGFKAVDKAKAKRNLRKQMTALNSGTTKLAKAAKPVKAVSPVKAASPQPAIKQVSTQNLIEKPIPKIRLTPAPPVYTVADFMKINEAVNKNQATPDQVAMLVNQFHQDRLQTIMNF